MTKRQDDKTAQLVLVNEILYFECFFAIFGTFFSCFENLPIVTRRGCGEFGELLRITGSS